jgi:hypothetical protein
MKKLIALALGVLMASATFAGTSPQASADESTQASADFAKYPRVLTFDSSRNAMTPDGVLLVCPLPAEANWRENTCTINTKNAWVTAENALPGWVLKRYDIRMVGSGGYRHLILYFSKK